MTSPAEPLVEMQDYFTEMMLSSKIAQMVLLRGTLPELKMEIYLNNCLRIINKITKNTQNIAASRA